MSESEDIRLAIEARLANSPTDIDLLDSIANSPTDIDLLDSIALDDVSLWGAYVTACHATYPAQDVLNNLRLTDSGIQGAAMKVQTVTGIAQSPMNASRWCLDLACGHETWITATRRPQRKQAACERCDSHIEEGTMGGQPAERDARTGVIEMGPEVTRRAEKRKRSRKA